MTRHERMKALEHVGMLLSDAENVLLALNMPDVQKRVNSVWLQDIDAEHRFLAEQGPEVTPRTTVGVCKS